ncbi:hypothetical protein KUCAC02_035252 [Chaenocephalus aceratus]|nr:hypothetical protein KUCAC02_035252 [Chaenocephalus aceratus]
MSLIHSFCQDLIKGFAQTWSKGEEEVEEEEEEEDEDTSAETEEPSSSFESTEGRTEDTRSDVSLQRHFTCPICLYYYRVDVIGSFQKPEELPEESTPEQTADITAKPDGTSEEKPANGTTESNSSSQSATSKKVQYEILLTKEQQVVVDILGAAFNGSPSPGRSRASTGTRPQQGAPSAGRPGPKESLPLELLKNQRKHREVRSLFPSEALALEPAPCCEPEKQLSGVPDLTLL